MRNDVRGRLAIALAARLTAFERVIGEDRNMSPPSRLVVVGRVRSLSNSDRGHERRDGGPTTEGGNHSHVLMIAVGPAVRNTPLDPCQFVNADRGS